MSEVLLLEGDPVKRAVRTFHALGDGTFVVEQRHDVEPIIEDNKARERGFDGRASWRGDWHRVASIPLSLWMTLRKTGLARDPRAFRRWLNDPDNALFRTRPGRV
ncbi:MAG: hypothetical protein ACREDF_06495 [Thermoplasmata archaeon]